MSLTLGRASGAGDNSDSQAGVKFQRCAGALRASGLFESVLAQPDQLPPSIRCTDSLGVPYRIIWSWDYLVNTSRLLAAYIRLDDRCRRLCIALRCVARLAQADAPERGTLPPHAFNLMVVHYLQQVQVLPVLNAVAASSPAECCATVAFEDGQVTYFNAGPELLAKFWQQTEAARQMSLGHLWLGLLRHYSVPRRDTVVCVTQTEPLLCSTKDWQPRLLNIEDPFRSKWSLARIPELHDYILTQICSAYCYYALPQTRAGPLYRYFKLRSDDGAEEDQGASDVEVAALSQLLDCSEPGYYNRALADSVTKDSLSFTIDKRCLINVPPPQPRCLFCGKNGHLKEACTQYEIAPIDRLPACPPRHLAGLTDLLRTVPRDFEETSADVQKRAEVVNEILGLLREQFPGSRLELFGSCSNGFGFRDSDIDLCLTFDGCPDLASVSCPTPELIAKVAEILESAPSRQFEQILPLAQAKVPIVKFHHRRCELEGDVSLYNQLAACNTRMLRTYAMLDRRVQDLGYIAKVFAKSCSIGDASRGSLSSYAYVILALHYLQFEGLVPCLQELHDSPAPQRQIDGWNAWFQEDRAEIAKRWQPRCSKGIGELWLGFLSYYLQFDWRARAVTIRQSRPLLRMEKLWAAPLAIEDPFNLSHNLGSGLTKKMAWYILTTFQNALTRLCTTPRQPLADMAMKEFLFSSNLCPRDCPMQKDRGCHRCGKLGHQARDCEKLAQSAMRQAKQL